MITEKGLLYIASTAIVVLAVILTGVIVRINKIVELNNLKTKP